MKNILMLCLFATVLLLSSSCKTVPIKNMGVSFTDGKENLYSVKYDDDEDSKKALAIIDVKGKRYGCMVDYKDSAPDAIGFNVDISAMELTGCVKFTYKRVTVECEVTNKTLPEELYTEVTPEVVP